MTLFQQKTHQGFTLVELMMSLSIGLVIALAAVQLFITNYTSFNMQSGLGDVSENGRFALDFMNKNIRVSEYSSIESGLKTVEEQGVITIAANLPGGSTALSSVNDGTAIGIGNSDQLVVRTWVPSSVANMRDCEGNLVTSGNYIVSRYFLRADSVSGSPSALACDAGSYNDASTTVANFGGTGVVLLSSVDSFQVMYGIAASSTANPVTIVRYVNPADYLAITAPRPIIAAVRIGLLVRSTERVSVTGSAPSVRVLDKTIASTDIPAADKNRVRRAYSSTVVLRNVM